MTTADEQKLIDIKFKLDMYYSMADTAESTLEKIQDDLNPTVKLNENQQIVLDVLKKNANQGLDELIVGGITYMNDEEINAIELSQQEELFQVLAAFAEWGMKEVAE